MDKCKQGTDGFLLLFEEELLCLGCGCYCSIKVEEVEDEEVGLERDLLCLTEDEVFLNFCQLLKVKVSSDGHCNWSSCDEDKKKVPMCVNCKNRVLTLVTLQQKIRELEFDLKQGSLEFKKMCELSEGKFVESGIYERDQRFAKIRKQIMKGSSKQSRNPTKKCANVRKRGLLLTKANKPAAAETGGGDAEDTNGDQICNKFSPLEFEEIHKSSIGKSETHCLTVLTLPENKDAEAETHLDPVKIKVKRTGCVLRKTRARSSFKAQVDDNKMTPKVQKGRGRPKNPTPKKSEKSGDFTSSGRWRSAKMETDPDTRAVTYKTFRFDYIENVNQYSCTKCKATIPFTNSYKSRLRDHIIRSHTERFVCSECGHRAPNNYSLKSHINIVHKGIKRNTVKICGICGKPNLHNVTRLQTHLWTHYSELDKLDAIKRGEKEPVKRQNIRKLQCDICGKKFMNRSIMERHKICLHASEEEKSRVKELCPICGKSVLSFNMNQHMKSNHPSELQKFWTQIQRRELTRC